MDAIFGRHTVDDTLFRRRGHKVYAAHWGYDGSLKVAKGNRKLSRGNTFVVATVVVSLPFLDRPIALPVLAGLWRKGGPAKTVLARELIERIAAAIRGRSVHVVADGAYLCTELRRLPPQVTLTGPLVVEHLVDQVGRGHRAVGVEHYAAASPVVMPRADHLLAGKVHSLVDRRAGRRPGEASGQDGGHRPGQKQRPATAHHLDQRSSRQRTLCLSQCSPLTASCPSPALPSA
jgi:hypothetical protein